MITVTCKQCNKFYKVKDTAAGKSIDCECGNVVKIPTTNDEMKEAEKVMASQKSDATATERKVVNRRFEQPDLTNQKVCSKCKNLIDMSVKICPKCGFNTMGVKYDQSRREEISRNVSVKIFNVLKYLIPLILLSFMIWLFKSQVNVLDGLTKLEDRVRTTLESEKAKMDLFKKDNPQADSIMRFEVDKDGGMPYFLAFKKNKDTTPFSIFGSGYFTLRRPGVNMYVKSNSGVRKNRHYIEGEDGNLIILNPAEYEFIKFESLAYKFTY